MKGNSRKLIIKNITQNDLGLTEFSVEAKGHKCSAKLSKQNPWVQKMENAEGFMGDIAIFKCKVTPATPVNWYIGSKKIDKQNFR